jgi:hypothetical protein
MTDIKIAKQTIAVMRTVPGSLPDLCLLLRKVPDFAGILVEKTSNSVAILSFSPENPALPDDFLVTKSLVRQTASELSGFPGLCNLSVRKIKFNFIWK